MEELLIFCSLGLDQMVFLMKHRRHSMIFYASHTIFSVTLHFPVNYQMKRLITSENVLSSGEGYSTNLGSTKVLGHFIFMSSMTTCIGNYSGFFFSRTFLFSHFYSLIFYSLIFILSFFYSLIFFLSLPPHNSHKNTNVTQLVDTTINPTNQTSIFLFSFSLFFLCSPPPPPQTHPSLLFFYFRYPLPRRGSWVVETFFKLTKRYCSSAQPFGNPPRNQTKESIASFRTLSHLNLTGVVKRRVGNAELSALEWKSQKKGGGFVRGFCLLLF